MSVKRYSKTYVVSYIILFVIVLIIAGLTVLHHSIKEHLAELCRYKCSEIVNDIITGASESEALKNKTYYRITRDDLGRIVSVEADTALLNEAQSFLRRSVSERLSSNEYDHITVTLGDLTNITYFSGRGPDLHIRFQQSGIADTSLDTSFNSAGINQTRFLVKIRISVEFTAFLPTGQEDITVSCDYIAADTVIVGELPDYFLPGGEIT